MLFGWIKKLLGGERRTTAGDVALDGDPEGLGRLRDELGAMTAGEFAEAMGQASKAMGKEVSPAPSVPAGLLPPGNEEFRRERLADAMQNDSAARWQGRPGQR